jgi:DNA-binding transcriptional LysR family regulator
MNLTLVRAFVSVAEASSFTTAAKTLDIPTSSISRAVTRLEEDLRTKLFERTTRKTALSAAGRVYYEYARQALDALEEGESRVSELLGQPRGEVKLTVPVNLDSGFLARQLVAFSRAYPQVRLMVVPTNRRVDMSDEGFDLALRVQQKSVESPLALRELGVFHAWLVASPGYLRSRGRPRSPADLTRHTCVNMQSYSVGLRLIGPRGIETVEVSGPVIANDMHLTRQLVEQGAGIGPFVFSPGDGPTLGKSLVRVLPDYVVDGPRLFVATTSRKSQPLRVRLLREFLINAYARLGTDTAGA